MADGTPDFADLLAAYDDPPAVHLQGIGMQQQNQMQHQFGGLDGLQQQLNNQYGLDNSIGQMSQTNPIYRNQGHLRQISADRPAPVVQQNMNQNFIQSSNDGAVQSTIEDQGFGGGSLGSMFLSSVESLLSDEGSNQYTVKMNQQQQPPPQRQTQRRPRQQRQRQNNTQPRVANPNRVVQNMNTNSSVTAPVYNKLEPDPVNFVQSPVAAQNLPLTTNNVNLKLGQVSSSSFVLPAEMQMQTNVGAAVTGQQKMYNQSQFMHPTQAGRQQIPNPPRPLSATSSTSDHPSRPGSVPQPSPSCGSNHSGDPATPLTPQSYNSQNYNAGTPQSRSITPQQQLYGSGEIPQQMPAHINTVSNDYTHSAHGGRLSSHQSPIKPLTNPKESLPDLSAPVKDALFPEESDKMPLGLTSETNFPNISSLPSRTMGHGDLSWMQSGGSGGIYPNAGLQDFAFPGNLQIPQNFNQSMSSNYVPTSASNVSTKGQTNTNFPNAPSGNSYSLNPHDLFDHSNDSGLMPTDTLTQKQSKLLEQMASRGRTKSKSHDLNSPQSSLDSDLFRTAVTSNYATSVETNLSSAGMNRQQMDRNTTIDMMNKASHAGAATVKELFNPPTACYEAISPVSDYAMSPVNKTNMTEDTSESSLYSTTKFQPSKADISIDQSIIQGDAMTDPVLMYLKHDTVSSANAFKPDMPPHNLNSSSFSISHSGFPTYPTSTQNNVVKSYQTNNITDNYRSNISGGNFTDPVKSSGSIFNSGTGVTVSSLAPAGFMQPHRATTVTNADWNSLLGGDSTHLKSYGKGGPETLPHEGSKSFLDSQTNFFKKDESKDISPPNLKSPGGKTGNFGVNRRRSSAEKSGLKVGKGKGAKSDSFDPDFGFGTDEPTIRLSKSAESAMSSKLGGKKDSKGKSTDQNMTRTLGPELQDAMEQLKQQKEMLQRLQQIQASHPSSSASAIHKMQTARQQTIPRGTIPSATHHYKLPLVEKFPTSAQHLGPIKEERKKDVVVPPPTSQKPIEFSHTVNRKNQVSHAFESPAASHTISHLPTKTLPPQNKAGFYTPPTTDVTSIPQQILQFVPAPNLPNHTPSYLNRPLLQPNPFFPSTTSVAIPSQTSHAVNTFLTSSAKIPNVSIATTYGNSAALTSTPLNNSSAMEVDKYDLEWLHQESENRPYLQQMLKSSFSPPASTESLSFSLNQSLTTTSTTNTVFTTSTISTPFSHKQSDLISSTATVMSSVTSKPHESIVQTVEKTQSAVPTVPVTPLSPIKEAGPVHHEQKHHYGKKHRILEGSYPSLSEGHYKFGQTGPNHLSNIHNQPSEAKTACSVLDKQRRYSKERKITKPKGKAQHVGKGIETMNNLINMTSLATVATVNTNVKSATVSQVNSSNSALDMRTVVQKSTMVPNKKEKDPPPVKDDQTGSMLSLFNSLLQEASKSAADSLKTKTPKEEAKVEDPEKKEEIKDEDPVKTEEIKPPASQQHPKDSEKKKTLTVPDAKSAPASTVVKSAPVSAVLKSPIKPHLPVTTVPVEKKVAKQVRPAATVPFKRRPYPAIEDFEAPKVAMKSPVQTVNTTSILSPKKDKKTSTSTVAPVSSTQPIYTSKPLSTLTSSAPVSVSATVPVVSSNGTIPTPTAAPSIAVEDTSVSKIVGLPKLRITAFRSLGGQVIHQSSMVNSAESDQARTSHKHLKKKKKKKKRKRQISSSDYDSSVSSMTSISSFEPSKIVPELIPEQPTKILNKPEEKTKAKVNEVVAKKPKGAAKQKRANPSVGVEIEGKKPAKRTKVVKESAKRKTESKKKEPVARYQPKSAYLSSAVTTSPKTTVTQTSTFQRAPGKLPMYLNSTSESTVPTIQLVARNTKLLETGSVSNKSSPPPKIVSVKLPNSLSNKTFQTQILSGSYLVPGVRGQNRIILPNISTSMAIPVPVTSTLANRTPSSTLLPIPVSPLMSTTSPAPNKSPFLLIQQSTSKTSTSSMIFANAKNLESLKAPISSVVVTSSAKSTSTKSLTESVVKATSSASSPLSPPVTSQIASKINLAVTSSPTDANSFQSAFSKLISNQNPVPVYTPSSPPSHLMLDDECSKTYQCQECRDSFMFHSSLEDHYERRCIMIKVRCMQCNQSLVFLNKCKLLMHARQHSDKGSGMQFNNAHISPLPLSMCKPRSKESFLSPASSKICRRRSTVSSEDDRMSSSHLSGHDSTTTCTDCNFSANSVEALEEHFQHQSSPESPESVGSSVSKFTCDMCNLTLFNQCSFNAHMRMHKRIAPHTCPECGQVFDFEGKDMEFNLHLSIQCFHLSRMSCYKCRLCTSIFKNGDLLRRHLEVRHLQTFYKCRDCPMAFKTQENIANHQRTSHGIVAVTKTIHKCPLCDMVFTDNSPTQQLFLLQKHFEGHINHPSINITAYKCLFCNNIYERKSLLRDHLKSAHDVASPGDSSGSDLTNEINKAELMLDMQQKKKIGNGNAKVGMRKTVKKRPMGSSEKEIPIKIAKVMSSNKKLDDVDNNLLIASGSLGYVDGSSKKLLSGNPAAVKHTRQPLKLRLKGMKTQTTNSLPSSKFQLASGESSKDGGKTSLLDEPRCITTEDGRKLYPCNECSKEFLSSHSRLNHIRSKHQGIRTLYYCPHCPVDKIKFAKRISLVKHLKRVHKMAEITKQDIKTVSAHVSVPAGQRFDPSSITLQGDGVKESDLQTVVQVKEMSVSPGSHKQVRKKITALGRKTNGDNKLSRPIRHARQRAETSRTSLDLSSSDDELFDRKENENAEVDDESAYLQLHLPDSYTCAKCEYTADDRLVFQAHVIEHREDDENAMNLASMQQCTECGLCFASVASHNKHLFIKHKIKRRKLLEKYDEKLKAEREASGNLPKSLMSNDGTQDGGGDGARRHKCSVCFRRFEDDGRLRTHMRTHGLAFVKSKHVT